MFTRIQANAYKCLLSVDQQLDSFNALVGPNASGKTTFLDCIGFLSDLMQTRGEIAEAIRLRSADFKNLLWHGQARRFQLSVEATIPDKIREKILHEALRRDAKVRYEIEIGLDQDGHPGINSETLWITAPEEPRSQSPELFPYLQEATDSILWKRSRLARIVSLKKAAKGNDNYYPEGKKTYKPVFKLGRQKSTLANLPVDEESFPVASWFLDYLKSGVQSLVLNSQKIRLPSPPSFSKQFAADGSNLPWVIRELKEHQPTQFSRWLRHIQTALPDVSDISTSVREEDRHCCLRIHYTNGAVVPSWLVSDGTLRLLALTIPAYLPDFTGTFLIEEPENGIHPNAVETVLQSLQSMYSGQVLLATHSPIVLNMIELRKILCFAKDSNGATAIVSGDRHPALRKWKKGNPDLGALFASGILS
ncbi:MAG: ATP-binding protein [Verrucomicrobiales bacterium]|jgi:predicted ATPase|nr:ATP-binding protein [Verrucomicrobiales bacterium]